MKNSDIAKLIEMFISDDKALDPWSWDNFTTIKNKIPRVEKIRLEILAIERQFPDKSNRGWWCSKHGLNALAELAKRLKSDDEFR